MDTRSLIDKLLASPAAQGAAGGALSGGIISALTSKGGRKLGGSALKLGGLAAVGALAYHAYSRYRQAQSSPGGAGAGSGGVDLAAVARAARERGFLPPEQGEAEQNVGLLVLRAMIAAAKADGHIDAEEQARIDQRLGQTTLTAEEQGFVLRELTRPLDTQALVAGVDSPELASELYAASLLVLDAPCPRERAYLEELGAGLGLQPALQREIEQSLRAASL